MDSSAFNKWTPPEFEVVIFILSVTGIVAILVFGWLKPSAISLPTKDFQCTESAIVNGAAECVRYERREK